MSTRLHLSAEDKQLQFAMIAAGAGLVWGALQGIIAICQGKSQQEITTKLAKSATSAAAGTYLGQVTADQVQEAGFDPESSLVAGLLVGTAAKFGTRAIFDATVSETAKEKV